MEEKLGVQQKKELSGSIYTNMEKMPKKAVR